MKKLDTSPIATNIGFPVKSGTALFLQQAYQEGFAAVFIAMIGSAYSASVVYLLSGCTATGTDPGARTFTAGAAFFNGEFFIVPTASFTSGAGQVAVGNITTSFFNDATADPVKFTDGVSRNVHQIRQMVITAGVSGSAGANGADFSTWLNPLLENKILAAYGTGFSNPNPSNQQQIFYRKDRSKNVVYLGGIAAKSSDIGNDLLLTLPVGYRPIREIFLTTFSNQSINGSANAPILVVIDPATGQLYVSNVNAISGAQGVTLEGLYFFTD